MEFKYKDVSKVKYRNIGTYVLTTKIEGYKCASKSGLASLSKVGVITVKNNYGWDGPSGPTLDTKDSIRASMIHDVFYLLMREKKVPLSERKKIDKLFRDLLREDGMGWARSFVWYRAVRRYAGHSAVAHNR